MRILKYTLEDSLKTQSIDIPKDAKFQSFGFVNGLPRVWMLVEKDEVVEQQFLIIHTGDRIPERFVPITGATVIIDGGETVIHLCKRVS